MKTTVESIVDRIEERHEGYYMDMAPEDFVAEALDVFVEEELPHVEEQLERFEGKKFTVLGKLDLLQEIREEVGDE